MTRLQQLFFLLILTSTTTLPLDAQGWIRRYGEIGTGQIGRGIEKEEDQIYKIFGRHQDYDIYNVVINEQGDLLSEELLNNNHPEIDPTLSRLQSNFGGYWFTGTEESQDSSLTIIRTDNNFNILFQKHIPFSDFVSEIPESGLGLSAALETTNGQLLVQGRGEINTSLQDEIIFCAKFDADVNLLWDKFFLLDLEDNYKYPNTRFLELSDGNILMSGMIRSPSSPFYDYDLFVLKFDQDGQEIWMNILEDSPDFYIDFEAITDVLESSEGDIYLLSNATSCTDEDDETCAPATYVTQLYKCDSQGQVIWNERIEIEEDIEPYCMTQAANGDLIVGGSMFDEFELNSRSFALRTNSEGELKWFREMPFYAGILDLVETSTAHTLFTGAAFETPVTDSSTTDMMVVKTDSLGVIYSNNISGQLVFDNNNSCSIDSNEIGLKNWLVTAVGEYQYFDITDENGNYSIELDIGNYEIQAYPPNLYWTYCDEHLFELVTFGDSTTLDIPMQFTVECPDLHVDISTPFLRRCFDNTYTVQYTNYGTDIANEAYVQIEFDPFLIVNSSSIPWSTVEDNTYTFPLGNMEVMESGSFTVEVTVDCDSTELGQSHCVEATIFPNESCLEAPANWDGANLVVDGFCETDSVRFIVKNKGADMSVPTPLLVVEDNVMLFQDPVQLISQEEAVYAFEATGATYYLEVAQTPGHPGSDSASDVVEGCGGFGTPYFGFFSQFPENDELASFSIDCQANIGAYDPNDKAGYPMGWDEEHLIEVNEAIEYKIRFQNTGTDTAFKVVILDTLSQFIDVSSIRPGVSSHPYQLDILPNAVLQFTFGNIMLPDSNANEAASHGFVKFKIDQRTNNPLGSMIFNRAAIYFDFNEPVITNTTFHTVGEKLLVSVQPDLSPDPVQPIILAYPNPTKDIARFKLPGNLNSTLRFQLFDTHGKLLRQENIKLENYQFNRGKLPAGIYFYRFEQDGRNIGTGKIVIQSTN